MCDYLLAYICVRRNTFTSQVELQNIYKFEVQDIYKVSTNLKYKTSTKLN